MTPLSDLAAAVPEVAAYLDDCEREEGGQIRCRNALRVGASGKAALTATVAHYEKKLLERERCGGCVHWSSSLYECELVSVHDQNRPWSGDCDNSDRCPFITPDHPHGKFEPIGGK